MGYLRFVTFLLSSLSLFPVFSQILTDPTPSTLIPVPISPIAPVAINIVIDPSPIRADLDRFLLSVENIDTAFSHLSEEIPGISERWRLTTEKFEQDLNQQITNVGKGIEGASKEWANTNSILDKAFSTLVDPQKMAIVAAATAAGATLGASLTRMLLEGIRFSVESLGSFIHKKWHEKEKRDKELLQDFAKAEKDYEQILLYSKNLEQQIIHLGTLTTIMQEESHLQSRDVTIKKAMEFVSRTLSELETHNDKYSLELEHLRPKLIAPDSDEHFSCAVGKRVLINQNKDKIDKLKKLQEVLGKSANVSNCQTLKDSYGALVNTEEQLEALRADILAAQDLWIHKKMLEEIRVEEKFREGRLALTNMKQMTEKMSQQTFDFWKSQFTSSIQLEVQTCIERMNEQFSMKYPDGLIDWDQEFQALEEPITKQFGFVKSTDDFSSLSWGEYISGKSWIRQYCETLVYNTPVEDPEKHITFTRLDFFRYQIDTMKNAHLKKQDQFKSWREKQASQATTLVTNPFEYQDRDLVASDRFFQKVFQDQLCKKEPMKCSKDQLHRVTRVQNIKGRLESLCGPFGR
jgi:hypothetical protein